MKDRIMHFRRRYKTEIGHLDIAPLIDVVFLLLIFFMLTSRFVVASGLRVHLPESQSRERVQQKGLVIIIDKKGDVYLRRTNSAGVKGEKRIDFSELSLALKSLSRGNKSAIIYADRQTALEKVIKVWDISRESGIKEIRISAIPKN
ncbi:MAG: hypothetical protein B5M48_01730 [Candidatus Omnitrophica bacterium 4484_213]|nr:MAG: hypothetical protein B5M48_01730 [Candidatus Omnitrophica bacterium 4484_213]